MGLQFVMLQESIIHNFTCAFLIILKLHPEKECNVEEYTTDRKESIYITKLHLFYIDFKKKDIRYTILTTYSVVFLLNKDSLYLAHFISLFIKKYSQKICNFVISQIYPHPFFVQSAESILTPFPCSPHINKQKSCYFATCRS